MFRDQYGLDGVPYVLCLGRVDDGKGAQLLARFFTAYKRRRPGPLRLVMAGPVVHRPDPHPDLIVTGPLDEASKWGALAGADLFVSPSPNESFSLVILDRLLGDGELRAELAGAGGRYVEENFRWPVLIDRYARFLIGLAERGRD